MSLKNPKECFCLQQQQTFFVLNELTPSTCENGSEPLTFHHETFSRFRFVIINKDKKAATANIPVSEIPGIFEEIKNKNLLKKMNSDENKMMRALKFNAKALQKLVHKVIGTPQDGGKPAAAAIDTNSPAFKLTIGSGTLKGKTPAGALLENPEVNKKMLENQVNWLKQNLAKYPKNQLQIDAINQALDLFNRGLLNKDTANAAAETVQISNEDKDIVWKTGFRPLIRRKLDNGKSFVYEIKIYWHEDLPKPVEIEIRNYYAPVIQTEQGLLNIVAKEREQEVKNSFSLTVDEWFWMQHIIESQISTFESIHAARMYKTANDAEIANRAQAFKH